MNSVLNTSVLSSLFSESPAEDLTPPRQGRWLRPMVLAVLAHSVLIAALTWGVNWNHDSEPAVFEAELWSKLPVEAAPRAVAPPPKPDVPQPAPEVPAPEPKPAPPPPAPPAPSQAEIAVQEARKKAAEEKRLAEIQKAKDLKAQEQKAREAKAAAEKKVAEKKAAEELAVAKKAAAEKAKQQKLAKEKEARERKDAELQAALREQQMARMLGQAGATGSAGSKGSAVQSSGPSASYKQKLAAAFRRNIFYANAESIAGNPKAEVQVSVGPTGQVIASKLTRSSGVGSWDDAVLRAAEKTTIPADEHGKYPSQFPVVFGPKD